MNLSIVIVNYKAWPHIAKSLDALADDFPPDWEIIIVDNESDPGTFAGYSSRYPWARMIANPENSGFGRGCVIGVADASGSQLLFMNPDVVTSIADIRTLMAEKSAHPDVGILTARQVGKDGRPQKVFDEFPGVANQSKLLKALARLLLPGRKPDPRATYDELVYCDWVTGSLILIDREDYDRIGGWSADYWMYAEDADLCKRAHDLGMRVAFTPAIEVFHAHGGSSRINVDVKSMTKLEVIISKHVYVQNHMTGLRRLAAHVMIALVRLPGLLVTALLNVLTLGRVPALRVRARVLSGLLAYYARVARTGSWLSPRAIAIQS